MFTPSFSRYVEGNGHGNGPARLEIIAVPREMLLDDVSAGAGISGNREITNYIFSRVGTPGAMLRGIGGSNFLEERVAMQIRVAVSRGGCH